MFFRDRRKHHATRGSADPTAPDGMFPHLPRHRADFLREQTIRLLNEEGFDTSWRADGLIEARCVTPPSRPGGTVGPVGTAGTEPPSTTTLLIGLETLSLQLADAGAHANLSELLDLIRRHIHTVTTGTGAEARPDLADLPDADFLRHLRIRLATGETLAAMSGTVNDASREFTGDLHVSLALDTPDTVVVLDDAALAAHGSATAEELSDLYRVGYRNTWQELTDCQVSTTPVQEIVQGAVLKADTAARFWTVESDSFFLASAALFLEDLLPRWLPGLDMTHGVLVAVPHRHLMLVREVSTGQDLVNGIKAMSTEALTQHRSNPGPLSARLHLWHDGETTAFTDISTNADGQQVVAIHPDAYLASRIES